MISPQTFSYALTFTQLHPVTHRMLVERGSSLAINGPRVRILPLQPFRSLGIFVPIDDASVHSAV